MTATGAHLRWPAERFYWAVLDASDLPRGSRPRSALGYLFEGVLPGVAIEEVQTAFSPVPGDERRYVGCAVAKSVLAEAVPAGAVTLAPECLPEFVPAEVDPARLNVLTGRFAPAIVRRQWGRLLTEIVVVAALVALSAVIGFERHAATTRRQIESVAEAEAGIYRQVLGPGVDTSAGAAFPARLGMVSELRRLERTRGEAGAPEVTSAAAILSRFLECWPDATAARTRALNVDERTITLVVELDSAETVQPLADALAGLAGWRLAPPEYEGQEEGVLATIRLQRRAEP